MSNSTPNRRLAAPAFHHLPPPSPALHPPRGGPLLTATIPQSDENPFFTRQLQATLSRSSSTTSLARIASQATQEEEEEEEEEGEPQHEPLFLGFDCSTQALKCSLLDSALDVLAEAEVRFDRDLPHYGTKGGVLSGPEGSGEVHSPVLLCVEAMDLLCDQMRQKRWPTHRVKAVSAAGQQHASVYWSREASTLLGTLSPRKTMREQLDKAFSRNIVPNWQDSSTSKQCRDMESFVGGPQALAQITGSRAHERFTGPQIARFREIDPEAYKATDRISLVSSFITTLLCADGEIKGIDESDACGMNLWDMSRPERGWSEKLLSFCAGEEHKDKVGPEAEELKRKLGVVESDGGRAVGHIGRWFVERYGFAKDCLVCPGTGDNPATYLSFVLGDSEGLVSLGTSDTVLVSTSSYNPHPEFHNFAHPAQKVPLNKEEKHAGRLTEENDAESNPLRYFAMLVYKNGSLARENVRDEYCEGSWDKFNAAVEAVQDALPPKQIGYYWYCPDIIPSGAQKLHRYVRNDADDTNAASAQEVDKFDNPTDNAAAILHSQFLNYRHRSSNILTSEGKSASSEKDPPSLKRIFAVGGAAANPVIVQTLSDVLGCDVCKPVVELDEDDDSTAASPEPDSPNAGSSTPNGKNGSGGSSGSSGNSSKQRKTRNADFNSCSVAAAYKAKWAYVRFYNAKQRQGQLQSNGNGNAAAQDISFEDMVNNSKAIRRLRRAVTRQLRITNVPSAHAENGNAAPVNGSTTTTTTAGKKSRSPKEPQSLAEPVRAAAVKEAQQEAEEHDEGVAVVASPRLERSEAFAKSVTWWKELEQRAVSSSLRGEGSAK